MKSITKYLFSLWLTGVFVAPTLVAHGFVVKSSANLLRSKVSSSSSSSTTTTTATSLDCICINCKHVINCKAYHFVESKHEQPHMNEDPTFEPVNGSPTIEAHIRTRPLPQFITTTSTNDNNDQQEQRQLEGLDDPDQIALAHLGGTNIAGGAAANSITNPSAGAGVTVEYDVVKCASFVLDKGCWVRNMPEAIKVANPNFVPS